MSSVAAAASRRLNSSVLPRRGKAPTAMPPETQSAAARREDAAVQISLGGLIAGIAAGRPAQDRPGRVGLVPAAQPALRIQMKRLGKHQPAVGPGRAEAGFGVPVGGALGFLDLFLRE